MASKNEEDPESFYPKHNVRKINGVKRVQFLKATQTVR